MSESIVTLGIGATPSLTWFITSGLHVGAAVTYSVSSDPFDLEPAFAVIDLEAPPLSSIFNFYEPFYLVNQSGAYLTDQNGNKLVGRVVRAIRSNVIDLGA